METDYKKFPRIGIIRAFSDCTGGLFRDIHNSTATRALICKPHPKHQRERWTKLTQELAESEPKAYPKHQRESFILVLSSSFKKDILTERICTSLSNLV